MWTQSLVTALLVTNLLLSNVVIAAQVRSPAIEDDVGNLITLLRSSDEEVRQAAKEKLLELGPKSVPYLVVALKEILGQLEPLFAIGKEAEGRDTDERLQSAYKTRNKPAFDEAAKQLSILDISCRLRCDLIDLLVSLRAEEAIPILVRFIWSSNGTLGFASFGKVSFSREEYALIRMGPVAVPKIIEVLEGAETIADSICASDQSLNQIEKERIIKQIARSIQIRSILLLEEIADARCLPVLRKLLQESKDDKLITYLRPAITTIERNSVEKNN